MSWSSKPYGLAYNLSVREWRMQRLHSCPTTRQRLPTWEIRHVCIFLVDCTQNVHQIPNVCSTKSLPRQRFIPFLHQVALVNEHDEELGSLEPKNLEVDPRLCHLVMDINAKDFIGNFPVGQWYPNSSIKIPSIELWYNRPQCIAQDHPSAPVYSTGPSTGPSV